MRRCGRGRIYQEVTRGEGRCLVNHPGLRVLHVRVEVHSARANWVIGHAQVDGLSRIQRADGDLRLIDRTHKPIIWFSEQGDRGDVVGHIGRHRVRYTFRCPIRDDIRGDETHHGRALGKSTQHRLGARTARRHGPDMSADVGDAVYGGGKVGAGRIVDRIYADRPCADSRAQRVHKRLSGGPTPGSSVVPRANTTSTSGQGCADARGTGALSGAQLATVAAQRTQRYGVSPRVMLTYRDDGSCQLEQSEGDFRRFASRLTSAHAHRAGPHDRSQVAA